MTLKSILHTSAATLATLMLMSCGGSSSGGASSAGLPPPPPPPPPPAAADTQAPTIMFTASSQDVQGGETVVLSALANDNEDAQVDVLISCDRGDLQSDFLSTEETDSDFTISCTATATDLAGNITVETLAIDVRTTQVRLLEESTVVVPGEFVVIDLESSPDVEMEVSAILAGEDIEIFQDDGIVLFMVPFETTTGLTPLTLEIGDNILDFTLEVEASPSIEDPEQFLRDEFGLAITQIDEFLIRNADDLSSIDNDAIQQNRAQLVNAISSLTDMPEDEIMEAALVLNANSFFQGETSSALQQLSIAKGANCISATLRFTGSVVLTAGRIGVIGLTQLNPLLFPVGVALTTQLIDFLQTSPNSPIARGREAIDVCVNGNTQSIDFDLDDELSEIFSESQSKARLSPSTETLQKANRISFTNGQAVGYSATAVQEFAEEQAESFFPSLESLIERLAAIESVPDVITDALSSFLNIEPANVDESLLSIQNISNDNIDITLTPETIEVNFIGGEPVATNIDFTFDITLSDPAVSTTIPAQLNILPEADDVMVMVTAGETVNGSVQTRGAESVRLTSNPSQGAADLSENGAFSYTANEGSSGQDSFNYEAVNANGVSDPATVFVNIEAAEEEGPTPDFFGTFNVSAELSLFDTVCNNQFVNDSIAGPFTAIGGTERNAVFEVFENDAGDVAISLPPDYRPIIGEETTELVADDFDEEGRPSFGFSRTSGDFSNRLGISFIDDSNELRVSHSFSQPESIFACRRSIDETSEEIDPSTYEGTYEGRIIITRAPGEVETECSPDNDFAASVNVTSNGGSELLIDLGSRTGGKTIFGNLADDGIASFFSQRPGSGTSTNIGDFQISPSFNLTGTLVTIQPPECTSTETYIMSRVE